MKENLPSVSIIIPTYNAEGTLALCLRSIEEQDYPKEKIETVIVDAASRDNTLKVARNFKVAKILNNPLITAEAGKSLGVEVARNEIIALIDSDNILEGRDWLLRMVEPFKDPEIVGTEPLYYTRRPEDPLVVRYSALIGANDPLCMYLGNYDRYNHSTKKWTELPIEFSDLGNYMKMRLEEKNVPTIGANGFLVRRKLLLKTNFKPYLFDIDTVFELIRNGDNTFGKVKVGIVHLFARNTRVFIRKQKRRIQDYLFYRSQGIRLYPWKIVSRRKQFKFVLLTVSFFPLLIDIIKGYRNVRDSAWFYHFIACWITLTIYGSVVLRSYIRGIAHIRDRSDWRVR